MLKPPSSNVFELGLPSWIDPIVRRILGFGGLERVYAEVRSREDSSVGAGRFSQNVLAVLGIDYEFPSEKIREIREIDGPLLFVANHPFGGVDALVLMTLMGEIRPDFKFIGTSILEVLPELRSALIPVNVMKATARAGANIAPMRAALRCLRAGGALGFFPAGEVAELPNWTSRRTVDRAWSAHLGGLVLASRATVIPVYFEGENGILFRYAGLAVPVLRVALLVREIIQKNRSVTVHLGAPIPFAELAKLTDADSVTAALRERTFRLRPESAR